MKKTVPTAIISSLCTAVLLLLFFKFTGTTFSNATNTELATVKNIVEKNWQFRSNQIIRQLRSFASSIAGNNDFSLKVLVEHDRSSRIITEMASHFMNPMGFSVLEILDSTATVLSSGHFSANAGNKSPKMKMLSDTPAVCLENVMGKKTLSLQSMQKFAIADFPFFVAGGVVIDSLFLSSLAPSDAIWLILKQDDVFITNGETVRSISAVQKNSIIVNDKKYPVTTLTLPASSANDTLLLYIVLK